VLAAQPRSRGARQGAREVLDAACGRKNEEACGMLAALPR
jgi:hypothetical protein